jgi:hypothetical protein
MFDEVGLARAQPVTLAPAEERALLANGGCFAGRRAAMAGIPVSGAHRKVWNSRRISHALGSIDEIYICS